MNADIEHGTPSFNVGALAAAVARATRRGRPGAPAPARAAALGPRLLATSGAVILGSALALPPVTVNAQEEESLEEVTVTGSRIRRQDFSANSPITTIDESTFEETSTIGVETVLNQLPQFVPAVTQFTTTDVQNSVTNTVGASTVSLRGLGPNRNLVLIDGRRGQPVNAALVVDTNSIPSAAIERVEVISGGASAVYGADAVGGVVNFILKDDFEGATIDARYGITQEGDNEEFTVSALLGANVADDRGNVMVGLEHSSRGKVLAIDRDWRVEELADPNVNGTHFWFNETFVTQDSPFNTPSQAMVDTVFPELEAGTIAPNAQWWINPTPGGTGTVFTGASTFIGAANSEGGYKYDGPLTLEGYGDLPYRKVHPNGQVTENVLGSWSSIPLDRYSAFARGSFELSDGVTATAQAMFTKTRSETNLGFPGSAVFSNNALIPYGDDDVYEPSLADDGLTTLDAYRPGGAYGLDCPATGGCTESQAFPLPPEMRMLLNSRSNPNGDIRINRPLDFLGPRMSRTRTSTFQLVAGLEGEAFDDDFWDIHVSHGETGTAVNYSGIARREQWRAIASSPNFGVNFIRQGNEQGNGFAGGFATCETGLPLVREFEMSDDCRAALSGNLQNNTELQQNVIEANLVGGLAEMPAGPLQYALGAAYRDDEYSYVTDSLSTNESFTENALGVFPTSNTTGEFDVTELYGELLIPLAEGVPGFEHFNLELGGRYSDYSTVGGVETYKALIDWAIVPRARIRGGFNRANRAPNLGELFQSRTQVFGSTNSLYGDQCSQNNEEGPFSANPDANINGAEGAARTLALCREIMGETAAEDYYGVPVEDQPESGGTGLPNTTGNRDLTSEEADTFTLGVVIDFLDDFTLSVDYYEIEIIDMIAVESADAVFERCLSPEFNPDADPNHPSCEAILRDPLSGDVGSTDLSYTNRSRALTSGVDLQLNYSTQLTNAGGFNVNVLANYNLENITQQQADQDEIDWAGTLGCDVGLQCMGYDYRVFSTFSYFNGPWAMSLRWQHWPSIKASTFATNPETDNVGVPSSYNLFSLSGTYVFRDRYTLRAGIENLFDKKPPLSGGDPDADAFPMAPTRSGAGATYDPLGRRAFVNLTMNF